jgi:hypothetical protein
MFTVVARWSDGWIGPGRIARLPAKIDWHGEC